MAISEQLQQRIDALIGDRPRNPVQDMPYDPSGPPPEFISGPYDPRNKPNAVPMPLPASAGQGVGQMTDEDKQRLLMEIEAEQGALTPEEKIQAIGSFEAMAQQAQAPLAEQAMEIQHMGTGSDTVLAHLEPGDVIIPPALLEDDPEFESYLERKFDQYDIMPESRVMQGIGALDSGVKLNPHTGLPEFGFFKKIAKFAKKIIRPVAKIAQYIPGPWQPVAAMADKALTVYDVAKGDISPLALLSVAGPLRTGPSFGESFDAFKTGGGFQGAWANTGVAGQGGIADLFNKSGTSAFGGDSFMSNVKGVFQSANPDDYVQDSSGNWVNKVTGEGLPFGATDPSELLSRSGSGIQRLTGGLQGNLFGTEGMMGGLTQGIGAQAGTYTDAAGNVYSADELTQAGYSIDPNTGNIIQQIAGGAGAGVGGGGAAGAGGIGSLLGGGGGLLGGGGIGDAFKLAGTLGLAGALGKLAYEDTKNMKGVPITPMTAMGPTGRFNIEAEIARRMGQEAPNPVEFGLLPRGTIPELSGGKPFDESATILPVGAAYGGEVRGVPMQVLRPIAVPSMMPLPPAPINFEIPENYLAAKNAMSENIAAPISPPSSPLAASPSVPLGPSDKPIPFTPDPQSPQPIPEDLRPFVHPLEQGPIVDPIPPIPSYDFDPNVGQPPKGGQAPTIPQDPYMGQGGPSPEQLEKLRIDQEAWSTNPERFSSEPYWLNPFWYKPQGWRPTRPDTPTVGPSGKPFPIPPRRPMDIDRPRSPRPPRQFIGEGAPPSIGRPLPSLPLGPSDRPINPNIPQRTKLNHLQQLNQGNIRIPEPIGTPPPYPMGLNPYESPIVPAPEPTPMGLNPDGTPYVSPLPSASPSVPLGRSVRPPRIGTPPPSFDPNVGQPPPMGLSDKPMTMPMAPAVVEKVKQVIPSLPTEQIKQVIPSLPPEVIQQVIPSLPPEQIKQVIPSLPPEVIQQVIPSLPPEVIQQIIPSLPPEVIQQIIPMLPPEIIQQLETMPIPSVMFPMPNVPERPVGGLSSITEKIRRRPRSRIRGMNMGGMTQMARSPMPPILGSGYGPYVSMPNARGFANGGTVAMQDFQPMNGHINGIGTETSDEIPAMLSDGEFVMTGRGVRGAGSYVMQKNQGGIINLVPSLGEDRERGTQLMYGLMDEFGSRSNA